MELVLFLLVCNNLALLGVGRLRQIIKLVCLQGLLLSSLLVTCNHLLLASAV